MHKKIRGGEEDKTSISDVEIPNEDDNVETVPDEYYPPEIEGGSKRKKRNNHKPNCLCPICKNMKKNKTHRKK